jgi:hypothetical protein
MRKRHIRKRKKWRPSLTSVINTFEFSRDYYLFGRHYRELEKKYCAETVKAMVGELTYTRTKSDERLSRQIDLVMRLLALPGERMQGQLAEIIASDNAEAERGPTDKATIKRQITDALAAVRRWQADEGAPAILEMDGLVRKADESDDDAHPKCRYGILYVT